MVAKKIEWQWFVHRSRVYVRLCGLTMILGQGLALQSTRRGMLQTERKEVLGKKTILKMIFSGNEYWLLAG